MRSRSRPCKHHGYLGRRLDNLRCPPRLAYRRRHGGGGPGASAFTGSRRASGCALCVLWIRRQALLAGKKSSRAGALVGALSGCRHLANHGPDQFSGASLRRGSCHRARGVRGADARAAVIYLAITAYARRRAGKVFRDGPYEESVYFLATQKYSAFHTCNTWGAEALRAAGFHVHTAGVIFAGQLWIQARRLKRDETNAPGASLLFGTSDERIFSLNASIAGRLAAVLADHGGG